MNTYEKDISFQFLLKGMSTYCKSIVLVTNGHKCVVCHISEFRLTASNFSVCAITVMIVVQGTIIDHSRNVRMSMLFK